MPILEFISAVYPFVLLSFAYGLIHLHSRDFKPIVALWKVLRRPYVQFYRAWDPKSSMIQAFASLFFLSYAKLTFLIWEIFLWCRYTDPSGKVTGIFLCIDPTVGYGSSKHVLLMTFSVAVAVFVFLPPLLILVVYPTSLYRKISHWISPKWNLRIKTYVETFHGSFKDGTNGTRDYRSFSGLLLLLGVFPMLLLAFISFTGLARYYKSFEYIMTIFLSLVAFLCVLIQPYKEKLSNTLTAGILITVSMMFTVESFTIDSRDSEAGRLLMIILLLVPHCLLWGRVVRRLLKCTAKHRCKSSERESLLNRMISNNGGVLVNV